MLPIWYPSGVCNLTMRFDEAYLSNSLPSAVSSLTLASQPTQGLGGQIGAALGTTSGSGTSTQAALAQANGKLTPVPELMNGASSDGLTHIFSIIPKKASVEKLGYRQAWKFDLVFDYRDFPVDPRVMRALGVEIHVGAVNPADFATGITSIQPDGSRLSIIRTRDSAGFINLATLQLVGTVDEMEVEHTDTGSMVHMTGRDLRGIFADAPCPPQLLSKIDLTKPIDQVILQVLATNPRAAAFQVVVNPYEWLDSQGNSIPVPSPGTADNSTRVSQPAAGGTPNHSLPGTPQSQSYWDVITRYCYLVGAIPYFAGPTLRIRPARSLFDLRTRAGFDPRVPTPFAGGQPRIVGSPRPTITGGRPGVTGAEALTVRRMVYGRDVTVRFRKKFGGYPVPTIQVLSMNTDSTVRGKGKLLMAQWPPVGSVGGSAPAALGSVAPKSKVVTKLPATAAAAAKTKTNLPGTAAEQQVLQIPVYGIKNLEQLTQIAQSVYEEIGRGEQLGTAETNDLASYGGDNSDPDILRIGPGDAVEFAVDQTSLQVLPPPVASVVDHERNTPDQELANLTKLLGDRNLARVLVAASRGDTQQLSRFFRVNTVHLSWDCEAGVHTAFDFQNYVEARFGITPQPAPPPSNGKLQKSAVGSLGISGGSS